MIISNALTNGKLSHVTSIMSIFILFILGKAAIKLHWLRWEGEITRKPLNQHYVATEHSHLSLDHFELAPAGASTGHGLDSIVRGWVYESTVSKPEAPSHRTMYHWTPSDLTPGYPLTLPSGPDPRAMDHLTSWSDHQTMDHLTHPPPSLLLPLDQGSPDPLPSSRPWTIWTLWPRKQTNTFENITFLCTMYLVDNYMIGEAFEGEMDEIQSQIMDRDV